MSFSISSFFEETSIGFGASVPVAYGIKPLLFIKNGKQESKQTNIPFSYPKNPGIYFRGAHFYCISLGPQFALQSLCIKFFSQYMPPLCASALAGGFSAFLVCPSDFLVTQKEKTGKGIIQIATSYFRRHGLKGLYPAFFPTAMRETFFVLSYDNISPLSYKWLKEQGIPTLPSRIASGIFSGFWATLLTQTSDTFKAQKQRDPSLQISYLKSLFDIKNLTGFGWRWAMVSVATTAIPLFKEVIKKYTHS